jgi:hypothetical protein
MKPSLFKKALWPTILSVFTLTVFILIALGSVIIDMLKYDVKYIGNGTYVQTEYFGNCIKTTEGPMDTRGRFHGLVKIHSSDSDGSYGFTNEEVIMVHGERHGESSTTCYSGGFLSERNDFYIMGNKVAEDIKKKITFDGEDDNSAFQFLYNHYPWHLYSLYGFGFDSSYVEAYLDTVETLLSSHDFEANAFNDHYGDVVDELGDTPYDSIIALNSKLTLSQGLQELKNAELRLAVIDHYTLEGTATYDILTSTYPGY